MRRAPVVALLTALLALAACGGPGPSPTVSPSPAVRPSPVVSPSPTVSPSPVVGSSLLAGSPSRAGDLPPVWVRSEALWQSLAAGEAHPRSCRWLMTSAARAARLAGSATSYLGVHWPGKVYVVLLRGRFTTGQGQTSSATSLYLILATDDHEYLAQGFATSGADVSSLGRFHSYVPRLLLHGGLWGHTMVAGGPAPGGPRPIAQAEVAIWRGDRAPASGQPLLRVRSDNDGFFLADLPPGVYTLRLVASGPGWPTPVTARIAAGETVAAAVVADVP
jgi:hypothetical protein